MVHNLTDMLSNTRKEEITMTDKKTPAQVSTEFNNRHYGREAFQELNIVLGVMKDDNFMLALEHDKNNPDVQLEARLKRLHRWQKRMEKWLKVVSYYKRQCLYDLARHNGYGGITGAANIVGLSRQRGHMLFQEAEAERLMEFDPKELA